MRFTILAHRRTGSNHLVALLNSHPEITCKGEIFNTNFNFERHWPEMASEWTEAERRRQSFSEFLDVGEATMPASAVTWGYKLMPHHVDEKVLRSILSSRVDKIIALRRDNLLAQYSSELIAKKTGQGVAGRNAVIKTAKVKFDARGFEKFCSKIKAHQSLSDDIISKAEKPVLSVEYTGLSEEALQSQLCEFLQVKGAELKSGHKKRNDPSMVNRFINRSEVIDYLLKNDLDRWLHETTNPSA